MSVTSCEIGPSPRSSGGDFSCTEEELFESFMEIVNNPEIQEHFSNSPERATVHVEDEDSSNNVNDITLNGLCEALSETGDSECHELGLDFSESDSKPIMQQDPINVDNSLSQACKDLNIDQKDMFGQEGVFLRQDEDGLSHEDNVSQSQSDLSQKKNEDQKRVHSNEGEDSRWKQAGLSEKVEDLNCETDSLTEKDDDAGWAEESQNKKNNDLSLITGSSCVEKENIDHAVVGISKPGSKSVSKTSPKGELLEEPLNQNKLRDIEHNIEEGIRKTTQVCDELQELVNRLSHSSDEILEDGDKLYLEPCNVTEDKIPCLPLKSTAAVAEAKRELPEDITHLPQSTSKEDLDDTIHDDGKNSKAEKQTPCFEKMLQANDSSTTSSSLVEVSHLSEDQKERKKSISDSIDSSEGSLSGDTKSSGTSPRDGKASINWEILNTAFENPDSDEDEGDSYELSGNFGGFGLVLDNEITGKFDVDDSRLRTVSQSSTLSECEFREEYQKQHSIASMDRKKDDVLCSGYLLKLGGTGMTPKNWRKRWCVLRHDRCLYYHKTAKDAVPCGIVVLNNYIVSRSSEFHKKNCLKISKGGGRTYFFCSETQQDMLRWMEALRRAAEVVNEGTNFEIRNEIIHNVAIPALSIKKPDCQGYLRKQGGKNRTSWKRRYCVLKNGCLYYYREMADTTALGVAKLHGYKLEDMTSTGKRSGFRAIPPSREMRTFSFIAESEYDKKRWIPCIEQSIQNNNTSG